MGRRLRKHLERDIEVAEVVLVQVIITPTLQPAGREGDAECAGAPASPRPLRRPRPARVRRAHAVRRPRSRGVAPRAPESPKPSPAPEVALVGWPSNSWLAEASPGSGAGGTSSAGWLGLGRALVPPPEPRSALPAPTTWRWAVSEEPRPPQVSRSLCWCSVDSSTPLAGSARDSGAFAARPLRILQ